MLSREEVMREEARAAIIEALESDYDGYYCDLHSEVFNSGYYIVGTHQAEEALREYGVFAAIEKVQTYEKDNFGEIYTDLSDPEKIINMLYYIIGEEVLYEMMDGIRAWEENWNNLADEETNAEILQAIEEKEKQIQLFWLLRTLVRQGELRPAYARQIYQRYMESSGKEIPFGHALWLNRGREYDQAVFGSKKAAEDNTYCPVYKLPFVPGYDRRAGKARVFGTDAAPSGKTKTFKKILKNIKKVIDTMRVYVYNIIRKDK